MRTGLQYQDHIWHTQIINTIIDQLSQDDGQTTLARWCRHTGAASHT